MDCPHDRAAQDLGNIVALEHVNITVPDQQVATSYYVVALGLTRDPYLMTSVTNMWVNAGRTQFHLPCNRPRVLRGRVGLVAPDREALLARLARVARRLSETRFAFTEHEGFVDTVCPWGNRIRVHQPDPHFGPIRLGIAYVEFDVPEQAAAPIAHFYRDVMGVAATVHQESARLSHAFRLESVRNSSSVRPTGRFPPTTATTCRSTWRTSGVRIGSSANGR